MQLPLLGFVTSLLLVVAGYTQHAIPRHTKANRVALTRGILILTAIGFAGAAAVSFSHYALPPALVFLAAFGAVHLPAALILFFKTQRGEGRS